MKSPLSIGPNSFAHDFKTIGGSSSGPEALLTDKLFSKHRSAIVISLMHGKTIGGKVGILYRFSVEKTDENC